MTRSAPQQRSVRASRTPEAATDSCSAATKHRSTDSESVSRRSMRAVRSAGAVTSCSTSFSVGPVRRCRERKRPLGSRDDRVDGDVRQAPEVSRRADALFARPAGQRPDIDRRAPELRVTPGCRPHRQRGPVQTRRWASWWWQPRATARCLRRCRAVPGQSGHATRPTTCPRRFEPPPGHEGRRSRTRRTTSAAAAASDGPDVRMIRRLGPPADSRSASSTKESSGHRRNALPALTWTTTSSSLVRQAFATHPGLDAGVRLRGMHHRHRVSRRA